MSRIKELKNQYPHLNISLFDLMVRLDLSKSNKYLPLLCKIFSKRFEATKHYNTDPDIAKKDLNFRLNTNGVSQENLGVNEAYVLVHLMDFINNDIFTSVTQFMDYMERNLIEENDVMKYNDLESIRSAIALASMKEWTNDLEGQVIKEFEDDRWLILRPLTFAASAKYGATTRWCTTQKNDKQYFERYWRQGILVYFLNKKTGYKFAGFRSLTEDRELSFWNAEDTRVDFLQLEIDDYLYPHIKKIFLSVDTNKNLCSVDIQEQVHQECLSEYSKREVAMVNDAVEEPLGEAIIRNLWVTEATPAPIFHQ